MFGQTITFCKDDLTTLGEQHRALDARGLDEGVGLLGGAGGGLGGQDARGQETENECLVCAHVIECRTIRAEHHAGANPKQRRVGAHFSRAPKNFIDPCFTP
jgi:hypothetical protein